MILRLLVDVSLTSFLLFPTQCPPDGELVSSRDGCEAAAHAMQRRFILRSGSTKEGGKCFAWNGAKPLTRISLQNRNIYFAVGPASEREVPVCHGCKRVTRVFLRGSAKAGHTLLPLALHALRTSLKKDVSPWASVNSFNRQVVIL